MGVLEHILDLSLETEIFMNKEDKVAAELKL
jgi:hypothetical protein